MNFDALLGHHLFGGMFFSHHFRDLLLYEYLFINNVLSVINEQLVVLVSLSQKQRSTAKLAMIAILITSDPPQHDPSALSSPPPTKQSDLPARKMLDSYREAVIPLSKDKQLWQKYINFYHRVRLGRILEDLDTMAGIENLIIYSVTVNTRFNFYLDFVPFLSILLISYIEFGTIITLLFHQTLYFLR